MEGIETSEETKTETTVPKEEDDSDTEVVHKKKKRKRSKGKKNKDTSDGVIRVLGSVGSEDTDEIFKWSQSIATLLQMNTSMELSQLTSKLLSTYKLLALNHPTLA